MASQEKQLALEKEKVIVGNILFIPIILLLTIAPLIVRLKIVSLDDELAKVYLTNVGVDFFSQYKATFIIIMTGIMILVLFFLFNKQSLKKDKMLMTYITVTIIFVLFTILSTISSAYRHLALWGAYDKAEGAVIMISYMVIMLYTIYTFQGIKDYRKITVSLSVLVGITTMIGIFQYFGNDPMLNTAFGKKLIIPNRYAHLQEYLRSQYSEGRVFGTMFHYNYMGSFGAMMVPFFAVLTLLMKEKMEKVILGSVTIASMFLLFGSTSRAGLIGLIASLTIGVVIFAKLLFKKWKITAPIIVFFGIILIVFNWATSGSIFERIPTLVNDAVGLFMPADKQFDYKSHIPIKDILTEEGKTTLVTQTDRLTIARDGNEIIFLDEQSNQVNYTRSENLYTTQDQRYAFISFNIGKLDNQNESEKLDGLTANINGVATLAFKVDDVKGIYPINMYTKEALEIEYPETFGFEGKERLGSARGYIWSRSIPMLKHTLFLGYGPDTYVMAFPQNDLFGKWYAYEMPNMVVSKPHNLYLQIGIGVGVIALIAFLVLTIGYIVHSLKLYALRTTYSFADVFGIAILLAIIGYMGAGIFNDSVVSVAPIFWILLGVGIATNYLVLKERNESKEIV